uniref:AP2/ERF domain-containing protein n=1 Tax=Rhizochromulina marina TaxID=1034831 RepID=A0A7S2WNA0_9STRA
MPVATSRASFRRCLSPRCEVMLDLSDVPLDLKPIPRTSTRSTSKWSSKYKGVCRNGTRKWKAHINHHGMLLYLGTFDTQEEAAVVFARAHYKLHGPPCVQEEKRSVGAGRHEQLGGAQEEGARSVEVQVENGEDGSEEDFSSQEAEALLVSGLMALAREVRVDRDKVMQQRRLVGELVPFLEPVRKG